MSRTTRMAMQTPERWQRIKELVGEAALQAPADRRAFLDAACAGDADLRREVESLLAAYDRAGDLFEPQPPAPSLLARAGILPDAAPHLSPGRLLGAYRIIETI